MNKRLSIMLLLSSSLFLAGTACAIPPDLSSLYPIIIVILISIAVSVLGGILVLVYIVYSILKDKNTLDSYVNLLKLPVTAIACVYVITMVVSLFAGAISKPSDMDYNNTLLALPLVLLPLALEVIGNIAAAGYVGWSAKTRFRMDVKHAFMGGFLFGAFSIVILCLTGIVSYILSYALSSVGGGALGIAGAISLLAIAFIIIFYLAIIAPVCVSLGGIAAIASILTQITASARK